MHASHQAVLTAPIDQIDLEKWLFTMSDEDYQAAARGHHGAGTYVQDGVRGSVNVESVGGSLLIQHYLAVEAAPTRLVMVSQRSRAYLFHLVPVPVRVRWVVAAVPRDESSSTFTCTVEVTMAPVLTFLALTVALPFFLRRHVVEETPGFARDINRKLANHTLTPQ